MRQTRQRAAARLLSQAIPAAVAAVAAVATGPAVTPVLPQQRSLSRRPLPMAAAIVPAALPAGRMQLGAWSVAAAASQAPTPAPLRTAVTPAAAAPHGLVSRARARPPAAAMAANHQAALVALALAPAAGIQQGPLAVRSRTAPEALVALQMLQPSPHHQRRRHRPRWHRCACQSCTGTCKCTAPGVHALCRVAAAPNRAA